MLAMETLQNLEITVGRLFARFPALCGFSVQDEKTLTRDRQVCQLEDELSLADVGIYPPAGAAQRDWLLDQIAVALLELMDELPETRELLRGRTFARALH
jgi:hypothetical protein